jgi:hypothetical protein
VSLKKYLIILPGCSALPLLIHPVLYGGFGISEAGFRSLDQNELLTLLISLLVIKPLYLLLCAGSMIFLYPQSARPLRFMFWGLAVFLLGELTCGAYYTAFQRELMISEYIHAFGIAFQLGLFSMAAFEFAGERLLGRQGILIITFTMVLCIFPLLVTIHATGYRTDLFGVPYGFSRFEFNQWTEARAMPWMSVALLLAALFASRAGLNHRISEPVKIYLSMGAGMVLFSTWRVTLGILFAKEPVLFEFWEEVIELMLLSCVAFAVWKLHHLNKHPKS